MSDKECTVEELKARIVQANLNITRVIQGAIQKNELPGMVGLGLSHLITIQLSNTTGLSYDTLIGTAPQQQEVK